MQHALVNFLLHNIYYDILVVQLLIPPFKCFTKIKYDIQNHHTQLPSADEANDTTYRPKTQNVFINAIWREARMTSL